MRSEVNSSVDEKVAGMLLSPARVIAATIKSSQVTRRVSFSSHLQVETIVLRSDTIKEEYESTWYSRNEYRNIKKCTAPTVEKLIKGIPLDNENETARGLEHRTPEGLRMRFANRFHSIDAVLLEQEKQWEVDDTTPDPETISIVYEQASRRCSLRAYLMGKTDEEFVLKETREEWQQRSKMEVKGVGILKPANRILSKPGHLKQEKLSPTYNQ